MKTPDLPPKIVFEDKNILVLDKPAGLVVDRSGSTQAKTLEDWLEENSHFLGLEPRLDRAGIVHRLDKETSGLLVVAKTAQALDSLQKQFKKRLVKKKYLALVHGRVVPERGEISASIGRSPYDRKKFGVFLSGKAAKSNYRVIDYLKKPLSPSEYSYLEVSPETGRTHQIRVHLKHLGHPVVGDAVYSGRKTARVHRRWCPRQFLHASLLCLARPETGQKTEFKSPLPSDLKKALQTLHG